MDVTTEENTGGSIPKWFLRAWLIIFPGFLTLPVRDIYELSYLTWKEGPQMIGFTFAHNHPLLFFTGVIFQILMYIWLIAMAVYRIRLKRSFTKTQIAMLLVPLLILTMDFLPVAIWQRAMTMLFGPAKGSM